LYTFITRCCSLHYKIRFKDKPKEDSQATYREKYVENATHFHANQLQPVLATVAAESCPELNKGIKEL
jgi:hypothetical protein